MKVLFWSQAYHPLVGGIELTMQWTFEALRERGFEFAVITTQLDGMAPEEVHRGIPVYRFPFRRAIEEKDPIQHLTIRRQVAEVKTRFRPDLVHVAFNDFSPVFHRMTYDAHRAPTIVSLHGQVPPQVSVPDSLSFRLLAEASRVLLVGEHLRHELRLACPEVVARCVMLSNARPGEIPDPEPLTGEPLLVAVGSFNEQKNTACLLRAMPGVLQRFPQARLTLAGDGYQREELESLCAELGLSSAVQFAGRLPHPEVLELMKRSSLVLLSSHYEGQPGVILEAMRCGRPVVATRVRGTDEVVQHGVTGLLVTPDSPAALCEGIVALLGDPARMQSMSLAAVAAARTQFSWETRLSTLAQVYRDSV